jgi:hypothetical protein
MVALPNGTFLHSANEACHLALPQLPTTASEAHILPGLTHSSLISIAKLCDAGCKATFDATQVMSSKKMTQHYYAEHTTNAPAYGESHSRATTAQHQTYQPHHNQHFNGKATAHTKAAAYQKSSSIYMQQRLAQSNQHGYGRSTRVSFNHGPA